MLRATCASIIGVSAGTVAPTNFRIAAKHSGKCLDVAAAGRSNGDLLHQWEYAGADNQLWRIAHVDGPFYKITAKHSGKCLDVARGSHVSEASVHQWDWVGGHNQEWDIQPVDDVHCKLIARHSGKCLQVGGTSFTGNGSLVNQLHYVHGDNQHWQLGPDLSGFPHLDGGALVRWGSFAFAIANGVRVLLPDEETYGLREVRDDHWRNAPLWPFLHGECGPQCPEALSYPLIRVLTRYALNNGTVRDETFHVAGRQEWEKRRVSVFLSHSSRDRTVARRLADDLRRSGIEVWFDETHVRVGDSVSREIQYGLQQTDFVAVLLSREGVQSGWVEKEWQSRIAAEAEERKVFILPVKVGECEIPPLLRDRKFADLTGDYQSGLDQLITAIRGNRRDLAARPASPLRFITEGGTNTLFFSVANETYGRPVIVSKIGARKFQEMTLMAGVARVDLADLVEGAEMLGPKQAAINLSNVQQFILSREVVRIEPGDIVPFSLRLCCRSLDTYPLCRIILELIDDRGDVHRLPSDCIYLLRAEDCYPDRGVRDPSAILRRLVVRAAVPVADVLRTPLRVYDQYSEWDKRFLGKRYVIQVEGVEYDIPDDLLAIDPAPHREEDW